MLSWLQKQYMLFFKKLAPSFIKQLRQNDITLEIKTSVSQLKKLTLLLKNHTLLLFKSLIDVSPYDNPNSSLRFSVVYNFLSVHFNYRLHVYIQIKEVGFTYSLSSIFNSASWLEREAWDMFGIYIKHHKDLRRILTDYGFNSFPLRKDFPLRGFTELYYFDKEKRISYITDQSLQKFRIFYFKNPWLYEKI